MDKLLIAFGHVIAALATIITLHRAAGAAPSASYREAAIRTGRSRRILRRDPLLGITVRWDRHATHYTTIASIYLLAYVLTN